MTEEILNKIAIFQRKEIRRVIYKNEWWFSVVGVCYALTDSVDSGAYWRKLKQRLVEEGSQVVTICHGLKLIAPDGKMREATWTHSYVKGQISAEEKQRNCGINQIICCNDVLNYNYINDWRNYERDWQSSSFFRQD